MAHHFYLEQGEVRAKSCLEEGRTELTKEQSCVQGNMPEAGIWLVRECAIIPYHYYGKGPQSWLLITAQIYCLAHLESEKSKRPLVKENSLVCLFSFWKLPLLLQPGSSTFKTSGIVPSISAFCLSPYIFKGPLCFHWVCLLCQGS